MSGVNPKLHSQIERFASNWMLRHDLTSPEGVASAAAVVATFTCRCAPRGPGQVNAEHRGHWLTAMFISIFLFLDDQVGRDSGECSAIYLINRRFASGQNDSMPTADHPFLSAVVEFLDALSASPKRQIADFMTAFLDHLGAVEEEVRTRESAIMMANVSEATVMFDHIDELLRLRPLLIATEPNIRIWQIALGLRHSPLLTSTVDVLVPDVRRAWPHPGLDRALDIAKRAHPRTPGNSIRRSLALSETEALAVVLTYLANDLASIEKDRCSWGLHQEPNFVVLLEKYFVVAVRQGATPWDQVKQSLQAPEMAEAIAIAMYNTGVARLRTWMKLFSHDHDATHHLSIIAGMVDGNLESTIEHSEQAANAESVGFEKAARTEFVSRYGCAQVLQLLDRVGDPIEQPGKPTG